MSVFTRSKSYRIRNKEKNPEEEEEILKKNRHLEKLKAKSTLIKAEFEKHKKKILLSGSETSKANEAKLRSQLNELNSINLKKIQTLERLKESNHRIENENQNTSEFISVLAKFESRSPKENIHSSMDYHSNRTTFAIINNEDDPEVLGQKLAELKETCENIERLYEFEEESEVAVRNKYDELVADNNIVTQEVKELQKINDHFDKRFCHLKEIEFAAQTKFAGTIYDLNELKEITKDIKTREKAYKREKRKHKESEEAALIEQQNHLADIMVSLDQKKIEDVQVSEELKKITIKYDQLVEKKKSIKAIAEFSELIENLFEFSLHPEVPKDALKKFLELKKEEKKTASTEEVERADKGSNNLIPSRERSLSRPRESLVDRNFYLEKIYKFYERHPDGPDQLIDHLCELHSDLCFKEGSLKKMHDEFQSEKLKKENQLSVMLKDLKNFKQGSTRDLRSLDASEGGIFIVNSQEVTMNQAKFLIDTKKETDSEMMYLGTYEIFIMRCYLDAVEMVARFGKLLTLISDQADQTIPSNLKKLASEIQQNVTLFRKIRKPRKSHMDAFRDIETAASMHSEREGDSIASPDLSAAFQAFVTRFGGYSEKAGDFVYRLKQDTMISSFARTEDILAYLETYGNGPSIEDEVEKAIDGIPELRQKAIENMLKKLNTAFVYYNEVIAALQSSKENSLQYFSEKNHILPPELDAFAKHEPSEHVKNAMKRKWERMLERYEYDPAANYRSGHSSYSEIASIRKEQSKRVENPVDQQEIKEEEERLDMEDLKGKLNDLTRQTLCKSGPRSYGDGTAFLSKTKQDEERKRLLLKQKKEKMKQVLYNMSEDEYFEWNRKQIGRGEESLAMYLDDVQGLKRASTSYRQKSSSFVPIEGVKKMIENSKMLSKINILERSKVGFHGIKSLKFDILGNYIPPDPKIFPKSVASSPKRQSQGLTRLLSPNNQTRVGTSNGMAYPSSTRNTPVSEALDSQNDIRYRPSIQYHSTIAQQAKLKHISPSYSQSDLKQELDTSTQNLKSQERLLGTSLPSAQKPVYNKSQSHKTFVKHGEFETTPTTPSHFKQKTKLNNLLKQNTEKKQNSKSKDIDQKSIRETSEPPGKDGNELPSLKKSNRKKGIKQKRLSLPESFADTNELCNYFNLQCDPIIRGVYSSSLFASLPASPTTEELQFRRGYL